MKAWQLTIIALTVLFGTVVQVGAKPGNGAGNPGGGGDGGDTGCTGNESKTPEIAYLTEVQRTGGKDAVYTRDIVLASASGCDEYMVMAEAAMWLSDTRKNQGTNRFIRDVSSLRYVLGSDNHGLIVWLSAYTVPWSVFYLPIEFGPGENLTIGSLQNFVSPGYDVVELDVLLATKGDLILAMTEWSLDNSDPDRRISIKNLTNGDYEIAKDGNCHATDYNGDCYVPYLYSLAWDPTGDALYYGLRNSFTNNDMTGIARIKKSPEGGWGPPELILLGERDDSIDSQSVSLDGSLAYSYDDGVLNGSRNLIIGIIPDPDYCVEIICDKYDGDDVGVTRPGTLPSWTKAGTLLYRPIGSGEIREYVDPLNAEEGTLKISGAYLFDSGL